MPFHTSKLIHEFVLNTYQMQPLPVVTGMLPLAPAELCDATGGVTVNEQDCPAWFTVTGAAPIVK